MDAIHEQGSSYIMNTYSRFPLTIEHGSGMYVYDTNGNKYLDFVAGIAVNTLGHNNKKLVDAISNQCKQLIHTSNLYYTLPQVELAKKLVDNSAFDKAFFCNSGAEAIEAALKLSRKYAKKFGNGGYEIIAMEQSFHGRTFGAVTATGQAKYQKDFEPLLPGIHHVPFNDIDALQGAITDNTAAVLLEPIQGEGGIIAADAEYLKAVRRLCDEHNILLIFDEVQCGMGRTGYLFAHELFDVTPDVVALAKGLAGGVPIGAILATEKAASAFMPGDHASTFGGNPLATTAANVVVDELIEGSLLDNVKKQGELLYKSLSALRDELPIIMDVRGVGLMRGISLNIPVAEIIKKCIDNGLLLVSAGANIIRFVPALIATEEDIKKCCDILRRSILDATGA